MTGWIARMARGEKLAGIFQTPAGEEALTRLWRAAYAGEPVREEIQVGRRGGAERVDATLSRVQDAARGPQGVVLVLRDNTERIRTQAELRQTRAQIRSLTDQLNNNPPSGDGAPAAS
jgi:PAS domain S-box-containing protein